MVGDQRCCGINIKCFCFNLTVIFNVQVEVHIKFTDIFQLMVWNSQK